MKSRFKRVLAYYILSMFSILLVGCVATSPAQVSSIHQSGASSPHKDYSTISRGSYRGNYRGSYRGSFYEVEEGDTLYFIAYIANKNVNDIIRYNGLTAPYTLYPNQKLKLWNSAYNGPEYGKKRLKKPAPVIPDKTVDSVASKVVEPPVIKPTEYEKKPSKSVPVIPAKTVGSVASTAVASSVIEPMSQTGSVSKIPKNTKDSALKKSILDEKKTKKVVDSSKSKEYVVTKSDGDVTKNNKISKWLWPTKGRVIQKFSTGNQGHKGIDIAGQRGQPIVSTASGTIVYSGNALRGYGNLIIVKHNDNYLSAYAHNESLLVSEGQYVKSGQKIATMGSSGSNSVNLHFEIRYQGKSVNPERHLP